MKLLAVSLAATIAGTEALKIMTLGDSITGEGSGCWQAFLWDKLHKTGLVDSKKIEFVGTMPSEHCGFRYDGENEGHTGTLVTEVAQKKLLPTWLLTNKPDVVLMHLGTGDIIHDVPVKEVLEGYTILVEQMRKSNINIVVLVAQVLPLNPSGCATCNARVRALNDRIISWASEHSKGESPIYVVDQYDGFPSASQQDGVHPDKFGGQIMALKWYKALREFI
ncbi:hypothetical protein FRC14_005470 [Serendipita sp. 396]|nr:hypothetical protein FRC14_005470 [Serendipita sp. 396]